MIPAFASLFRSLVSAETWKSRGTRQFREAYVSRDEATIVRLPGTVQYYSVLEEEKY